LIVIFSDPGKPTVCELQGKTIFEIYRDAAAAISINAELYTPNGIFVKCPSNLLPELLFPGKSIFQIGTNILMGNTFVGTKIGILIKEDGSIAIGIT
jgi:hypothetical protein